MSKKSKKSKKKQCWDLPTPLELQSEEKEVLQLRSSIGIADWALKNRKLSRKTTRFHGKWSHEYVPFLVEPMDSLSDPNIQQVTVEACAQGAKTEIGLNLLGWIVDKRPGPTLIVMPTEVDTKRRVATRIKPLFESTPILLKHISGSANKINLTDATVMDNMLLYLGWSGSASALADNPVQYVILDEVGKFPSRIGNEADAVSLAKDRTTTYGKDSKIYVCSTPTIEGDSIDREYNLGDQRQWWTKCPYCERYQILTWKNVELETLEDKTLLAPEDYENGEHAWYVCPHCKKKWSESDRWKAVCAGKWVPKNCSIDKNGTVIGEIFDTKKRSYKITALMLYPGFMTIDVLAAEWVAANISKRTGDVGPLQNFINSRLAEPWKESEKITSASKLKNHIGNYSSSEVPEGVQLITCGADVQKDHIWVSVEGWGYLSEVWTIFEGRIETGDTKEISNYEVLRQFLHTPWRCANSQKAVKYIAKTAIDSRYATDVVYDFCRKCSELDIVPIMGDDSVIRAPFRATKIAGGTRIRYNLNLLRLKDRLFRLLFESKTSGPGFWHLPKDFSEDYIRQLCSEERQIPRNKKQRQRWVIKSGYSDNHLWDCKVYSLFASDLAGARSLLSMEELQKYIEKRRAKTARKKRPQSGFLDNLPKINP